MKACALVAMLVGAAHADPMTAAPSACVNREKTAWRQVRNAHVEDDALQFCTGDDCWSYDLVKKKVSSIAKLPVMPKPEPPTVDAKATTTHAEFCIAPNNCKAFDYKAPSQEATFVAPDMNAEHTLGAVIFGAETEAGKLPTSIMFDLTAGKQLARLETSDVTILPHGFEIKNTLYDARMKKIGKLAVPEIAYQRIGQTDVFAQHDNVKGAVVLQDLATAKVLGRVDLGAKNPAEFWTYVAAPEKNRLYAIGSAEDEGRIVVIDIANHALLERTSPTACSPGTHRVN
jgi:hypothetical protein